MNSELTIKLTTELNKLLPLIKPRNQPGSYLPKTITLPDDICLVDTGNYWRCIFGHIFFDKATKRSPESFRLQTSLGFKGSETDFRGNLRCFHLSTDYGIVNWSVFGNEHEDLIKLYVEKGVDLTKDSIVTNRWGDSIDTLDEIILIIKTQLIEGLKNNSFSPPRIDALPWEVSNDVYGAYRFAKRYPEVWARK